jgi:signal transduction histidine kinase
LVNFNRLGWRLGLAMSLVIVLTTFGVLFYAASIFDLEITRFVDTLEPAYRKGLERRFEAYSDRQLDLDNNTPVSMLSFFVPLLLPLLLGVIVAWLVARRTVQPLERIVRASKAVATGDLTARVNLTARQRQSDDEINQLAAQFNDMAASLQHLETERRETTAAIAHELRTPLMVLQARLEAMRDRVIEPSEPETQALLAQVQTLTRLVDDLRTLSLSDAGKLALHLEPLDVLDILTLGVASFTERTEARGIALDFASIERDLPVHGDRDRLAQVLGNLLENALRHTPDGGAIRVSAARRGHTAVVVVEDSGAGIPGDALQLVFERFYRADASRNRNRGGSGLGLAIVKTIVDSHHGQVSASNESAYGGARLEVRLPLTVHE